MKKVLLTSLIATSVLLTSCGDTNTETKLPNNTAKIQTEAPLTGKGSIDNNTDIKKETIKADKKQNKENYAEKIKKENLPPLYIAFASDTFKKQSKDKPYNKFVDNNDVLAQAATKFFKENTGKEFEIFDPKTKQTNKRVIREYHPIQFFDTSVKAFDYEPIKSTNPNLVQTVKKGDKEFFFFVLPIIGREYTIINDNDKKVIKKSLNVVSDNKGGNNEIIILTEDILNPKTATDILSDKFQSLIKEHNVSILWAPKISKTNSNSLKLTRFLLLNNIDGKLNKELLTSILKKQKDLSMLSITDGTNIKEILKSTGIDVNNLTTGNLEDKSIYDINNVITFGKEYLGHLYVPDQTIMKDNYIGAYYNKN